MSLPEATGFEKPQTIFDRQEEWNALVSFVCDPSPEARLGVVSGRLRQGKTLLLEALTSALDGFYFGAQEMTQAESLSRLGDALARYTGAHAQRTWHGWEEAVDSLLALGDTRTVPIVLDDFPELVRQSPSLPSALLGICQRRRCAGRNNQARLLLSGSSLPMMRRLFGKASPLRGLADLHLRVRPLGYRQAARLWGIHDPVLALLVHAVVGGTPAYRYDYAARDAPRGHDDFDAWVCRTALNPRTPLFHEAYHLLWEEIDHGDRAVCHSALAAVASGCANQGQVADCLGAPLTDTARCLALLRDVGLLRGEPDAFRPNLIRLRVTEPLLAFEHAAVRSHRSELEQRNTTDVWKEIRPVFNDLVVRPHFAQVCRDWVLHFADPAVFGARPVSAAHGSLPDPARSGGPELAAEVVVRGHGGTAPGSLVSVGLARWDEVMERHHLERVRSLLTALADRGETVAGTRPALYSGVGFSPDLRAAEAEGQVLLVGLDRLYGPR
ncbi:AAA family ATPase [Streptomyces sp. MMS24-I2-30]|uniref:AAA family ATPase n=1 Tax=Streptomyces sp. MMS24-I2-30 TaxID=3351564 RepID=UPI0038968A6E